MHSLRHGLVKCRTEPAQTAGHARPDRLLAHAPLVRELGIRPLVDDVRLDRFALVGGQAAQLVRDTGAQLRGPGELLHAFELALGSRGSFIGAFSGLREARDLPLEVTLADGTVVGFDWVGEPSQRRGTP